GFKVGRLIAIAAVALALLSGGGYYYWATNLRILPEVQQLVTAGQISADEAALLNTTMRGGDGFEKQLATRLTTGVLDAVTWREFSALVPPKNEIQAKLRPLVAQGAIKEEEYYLVTKDVAATDENPYKDLAKQFALERTITPDQWRTARAKILDPSVQKVKLLVSSGVLTASEAEALVADHEKADASNEAVLAKRLLQENSLTVDQWRKERFPQVPGKVDPIAERLKPLLTGTTFSSREAEWLYAALAGQKSDAEKALVERLLAKDVTPGIWRARNGMDYRLPDDAVLDPANLPPAIDLPLGDAAVVRLLRLDAGTFLRGSARDELGRRPNEQAQERVALAKPFYIATTETTQAQYMGVMPRNPSYWRNNPTWPVDQVDWNSIAGNNGFLARVNIGLGTKHGGQMVADLPTEEEWEYACRAGTTTSFNNGTNIGNTDSDSNLDALANYNRAANGSPRPVSSFQPNAWGLYDMHGNVAEWCKNRYIRGGSWQAKAANCRATSRNQGSAEALGSNQVGFRLVLRLKEKDAGK
ncbi:MAG TPA: formylglycine-generating enzyme family protein, partial [Acidobacteriota bacterium]|nr:formylglycine-generating enzyme family protein [Acidobacteriota bacterium]